MNIHLPSKNLFHISVKLLLSLTVAAAMEISQVFASNTDWTEGLDIPETLKLQSPLYPRAEVTVSGGEEL